MKIFENDNWEKLSLNNEVVQYGYYYPYRNPDGSVNPNFYKDRISGYILDVKEKKEKALNYFYNVLNTEICKNVTICVVPSHTASSTNQSGISILARRLANDERVDKVDYLLRSKSINKLASGGDRDLSIHLESIRPNEEMSISGDVVLLVDDVTTSGASLQACKEILLKNGAERVAMLALGKSIR